MDERFRQRWEVAAARRVLYRGGCDSLIAGQVSARDTTDPSSFWVTPYQYFDESTPEDVCRLDLDLNLLDGHLDSSRAVEFHAALYRARPDVHAIVHTHALYTSILATTDQLLAPYTPSAAIFVDEQARYQDDGILPSVNGSRIVSALEHRTALLMKNHGVIVVGGTVGQAAILALLYEHGARVHVEAVQVGGGVIPAAEVQRLARGYRAEFVDRMWEASLRRLHKSDPEIFADDLVGTR